MSGFRMHEGVVPLVFGRGQHPAETSGHAVRPDDEVKMEAEDGDEAQQHQAETLQNAGHVLIGDQRDPHAEDGLSTFRSLLFFETLKSGTDVSNVILAQVQPRSRC